MMALDWQAWFTLAVLVGIVVGLLREVARPDLIFLTGLGFLLLAGIVPPDVAFSGFSNQAVLTIGSLFIVAAGVQQTGAFSFLDPILFSKGVPLRWALSRLMLPTALLSAFLNNTPIVAMLIPRVQEAAHRLQIPAAKLLIPLSYAAILGGMVTLIGTSTNVIVSGLMVDAGLPPFGLFELTWIGLPAVLVVVVYFVLIGYRTLPDHAGSSPIFEDGIQDGLFEVRVEAQGPLVKQTVEKAGLRALEAAYLVHVRRRGQLVPASPEEVLQADDVLTFTGSTALLDLLLQRPGLGRGLATPGKPAVETLPLYEAVVADSSNLVGKTLREVQFRERYGGVVLAIQRRNERLSGSLGRIPIKTGDLLLIEAGTGFDRRWNAERDEFYLVAPRRLSASKYKPRKAPVALTIVFVMVLLVGLGLTPLVTATFAAALAMVIARCLSGMEAQKAVNLQVLIIIAAALGLGHAVQETGLTEGLAHGILGITEAGGMLALMVGLYVVTNLLTELITHKAAAVLMLPVALALAAEVGVSPKAFALIITVAAAASFITPIGYQTNLMVMAAGGYRYKDYLKVGFPVALLVLGVAVTMIYLVWVR